MTQINAELIYEKLKNLETLYTNMQTRLDKDKEEIRTMLDKYYATKDELGVLIYRLGLVQRIVFSVVGLILTGFAGVRINGIIK